VPWPMVEVGGGVVEDGVVEVDIGVNRASPRYTPTPTLAYPAAAAGSAPRLAASR
jgi:hypothetical protein